MGNYELTVLAIGISIVTIDLVRLGHNDDLRVFAFDRLGSSDGCPFRQEYRRQRQLCENSLINSSRWRIPQSWRQAG